MSIVIDEAMPGSSPVHFATADSNRSAGIQAVAERRVFGPCRAADVSLAVAA